MAITRTYCKFLLGVSLIVSAVFSAPAMAQSPYPKTPAHSSMALPTMYLQNLVLKFALSAYGKSPAEQIQAMKDLEMAILKFSTQTPTTITIKTSEDLAEIRRLYFPHYNSLQDELQERRSNPPPPLVRLTPANKQIAMEIESLWREQERNIEAISGKNLTRSMIMSNPFFNTLILGSLKLSGTLMDPIKLARNFVPDTARLAACQYLLGPISDAIQMIDRVGTLVTGHQALKNVNPGLKRFIELTVGLYYKNIDTDWKLNILSSFLDHLDRTEDIDRFQLMVLRSGPNLQKAMQILARRKDFGDELKSIFKMLESDGAAVPWRLIEKEIKKTQVPFEWISIEQTPIGVGTMAQTHKATIRMPDGRILTVAVRVLKPGIGEIMKAEEAVMAKIGPVIDSDPELRRLGFPKITPLLGQVSQMLVWEYDPHATAERQKKGRLVHNETLGKDGKMSVYVPDIIDVPADATFMVQEFVAGMRFEEFKKKYPEMADMLIKRFAEQWFKKAMITHGFFHGDPHEGNFSVTITEDEKVRMNLFDFGMAAELELPIVAKVLAMGIVIESGRPDLMANAIWENSSKDKNQIGLRELGIRIKWEIEERARLKKPRRDIFEWMTFASDAGIRFPTEFLLMDRGRLMITEELKSRNIQQGGKEIMTYLLMKHPSLLMAIVHAIPSMGAGDWLRAGGSALLNHILSLKHQPPAVNRCHALFTSP